MDGLSLTVGGSLGAAIVSAIVKIASMRRRSSDLADHAEKTAVPQPCTVEQSAYQAAMKANEHDHENIFSRLRVLEKDVSGLVAKVDATLPSISEQLRETKEMVRQLFDRIICKGGSRK